MQSSFSADCRQCPRLAGHLDEVKARYPSYHARPVAPFGDASARLLIVGLAPGMHGANRTGRPFTGDFAGILLYRTLHKFGFASHAGSDSPDDNLRLMDCRITNAVKCLPPQNKPEPSEIRSCNSFLAAEIAGFRKEDGAAILALGAIAHQAVLRALDLKLKDYLFEHGAVYKVAGEASSPVAGSPGSPDSGREMRLYDSYHCSRYNTQTRRLTAEMFEQVFVKICADLAAR
ncbi:MAG: uracil-DNA glycosylase [Nitrosospira sp.]|nr:uracil-DNA glycosylase [Nitrosospira sp.]